MSKPHPLARRFAANLTELIEATGLSRRELAERSGLTHGSIGQFMSGEREPSLSSVLKLMDAIPVKFERLVKARDD